MSAPNIELLGATYPTVSGVTLPVSGGGTATFPWVEGSQTITTNGTVDVTSLAEVIVNVSGGGGKTFETGNFTTSTNVANPQINFANTHTNRPFFAMIVDTKTDSVASTDTALYWAIISYYDVYNVGIPTSSSAYSYGRTQYGYKSSSGMSAGGYNLSSVTGSTSSCVASYLTNTYFKPSVGSSSRYFRSGRAYKWIAVWM